MPMTDEEFEEMIERGRIRLEEQLDKARITNKMTHKCNGKVDCPALGHLSICLSLKQ